MKIKFGTRVKVISHPTECCGKCKFCLGNIGYWRDTDANGRPRRDGYFVYEKRATDGCTGCNAIKPENLAPVCKLNRVKK